MDVGGQPVSQLSQRASAPCSFAACNQMVATAVQIIVGKTLGAVQTEGMSASLQSPG